MRPTLVIQPSANNIDAAYIDDLLDIVENGTTKATRTGIASKSVFGQVLRMDISNGKLPLLSSKLVRTRSIIHELVWMIQGDTDIAYLKRNNVSIWDSWIDSTTEKVDANGNLIGGSIGPGYGKQWRAWEDYDEIWSPTELQITQMEERGYHVLGTFDNGLTIFKRVIDQLANAIYKLKNTPDDRRIIVNAWNVGRIDIMQLPPCHYSFQFYTAMLTVEQLKEMLLKHSALTEENQYGTQEELLNLAASLGLPQRSISCLFNMRSNDKPLGNPYNLVQYALLVNAIAADVNMLPNELIYVGGDCHIYENQMDGIEEHIARKDDPANVEKYSRAVPYVRMSERKSLFDYTADDFIIEDYDPDSAIPMPVAV